MGQVSSQADTTKIDTRNLLTSLASGLHNSEMVRHSDIASALQEQAKADVKRLKAIYTEQSRLRPKVMRFRDLEQEATSKKERLRRMLALAPGMFKALPEFVKSGGDLS